MTAGGTIPSFTAQIFLPWGFPTSGSVDLDFAIPDVQDNDNLVAETITVDWDVTAAEFKTTLAGHSAVYDADWLEVLDGPWPYNAIYLRFLGDLRRKTISLPVIDVTGLGGGLFPQVQATRFWVSE